MLAQSASRRWPCRPALARQALLISKIEFEFELDFLTLKAPFAQGLRLNSKANSLAARAPIPLSSSGVWRSPRAFRAPQFARATAWRFGVLAFWRFWRFGVLAFWRFGVWRFGGKKIWVPNCTQNSSVERGAMLARDRPLPPRGRSLESVGAKFCAKFTSTVRKSSSNSNSLFRESAPPRPMGA